MTDITMQAMRALLQHHLDPICDRLGVLETTAATHTDALDRILKNTLNWQSEMTVMAHRLREYEAALKTIGKKLNIDLSPFLRD